MDAAAVEQLVAKLCQAIGVAPPGESYRVDETGHHRVGQSEKGETLVGPGEPSLDAFLYGIMRERVDHAAYVPEQPELDVRRIRFARALEILEQLDPAWARRRAEEQQRELEEKPFDDFRIRRREHAYELQLHRRMSAPDAQRLADEKYPRPVPQRTEKG